MKCVDVAYFEEDQEHLLKLVLRWRFCDVLVLNLSCARSVFK